MRVSSSFAISVMHRMNKGSLYGVNYSQVYKVKRSKTRSVESKLFEAFAAKDATTFAKNLISDERGSETFIRLMEEISAAGGT